MISPDDAHATPESEFPVMPRRGMLGKLGLATLGVLASGATAHAASPGKVKVATPRISVPTASAGASAARPAVRYVPAGPSPLAEVSQDWGRVNGQHANQYLRYLKSFGLKRVNPEQVIAAHAKKRGSVWNTLPPKAWWNRMSYVLRVVDRIALEMNLDEVEVISAYRTPAYNAYCGGRAGSWHQANVAVDIRTPLRASKVTAAARELRDLGLFRGGVGGYWNFTHIDARGQNINW